MRKSDQTNPKLAFRQKEVGLTPLHCNAAFRADLAKCED